MRRILVAWLILIALYGVAFAQAAPATDVDPTTVADRLAALWHSGAFVCVGIVVAFYGLSAASTRFAWLQTDHRAVCVAAALGFLTSLVGAIAQGSTPNLSMIVTAFAVAFGIATNPKAPAQAAAGQPLGEALMSKPPSPTVAAEMVKQETLPPALRTFLGNADPDVARRMYGAYTLSSGGLNYQGLPCPKWEDLPPKIQEHWEAASRAVWIA